MSPCVTQDARPARRRAVVEQVGVGAALGDAARGAGLLGRADQARARRRARPSASRRSTSMMPEPQMPVTPVARWPRRSRDRRTRASEPMTRKRGSLVTGSISTRSMAPGAARWPEADLRALEGGAGGRGAGEHPRPVRRAGSRRWCRRRRPASGRPTGSGASRQRHRRGVGADMAGDAGQDVDPRGRVHRRRSISRGPERQRGGGGEREGRLAELDRVDARAAGGASPGCRR